MSLGGKRTEDQIRHDLEFFCDTVGITLIKDIETSITSGSESVAGVPDFIEDPHQQEIYKLLLDPDLSNKQLRSLALMGFIPMSERLLNLDQKDKMVRRLGKGDFGRVDQRNVSYRYKALSFAAFNDKKL